MTVRHHKNGREGDAMTGTEFILGAYCDAVTFEDPRTITTEEAAYTIEQWRLEGVRVPATVTPVLFAKVWNLYAEKDMRTA